MGTRQVPLCWPEPMCSVSGYSSMSLVSASSGHAGGTDTFQLLVTLCLQVVAIVVICDNDSIHHARAVTRYLEQHPRLELLYGARYSPNDNPVERIWAGLKNYVANTAVTLPGRLRQIHAFFRNRSPGQMLDAAAPWTSPWLPPRYEQDFWNAA